MSVGKAAVWAVLGAGAVAFLALGRRAYGSRLSPERVPGPILGLEHLRPPVAPVAEVQLVAPAPMPRRAPTPAWSRRTDDGGPPLVILDDVEALARVITSEAGSGPLAERVALAWVARNRARARVPPVSVAQLVCAPCGVSSGNARPFSTRMPATDANRELAAVVLASAQAEDPTHGATSCFEPRLQDKLSAAGTKGHVLDARGVRYCWLRDLDYYGSVGRWDLFGPRGGSGARPVPSEWRLEDFSVCCSNDNRTACRGKRPGEQLEV